MTTQTQPMRFGLVGTGHWARIAHAPALASTAGIEFAAVWGRDQRAASDLAARHGATSQPDFDRFLAGVDAIAFAVPPDVQSTLALRAADAGKHLLLEKPITLSVEAGDALVSAVERAKVASVVFFTSLFQADVRSWLAELAAHDGWTGGSAVWLGTALAEGNPFNTPWRRDKGGLWDLAPHLIALLWTSLGPVTAVTADSGPADGAHLILHHRGGASSVITVTLSAAESAGPLELYVWGHHGRSAAPSESDQAVVPLRTALTELAAGARTGRLDHPCGVRFGRDVVRVLAEAQQQLDLLRAGRPPGVNSRIDPQLAVTSPA
jgi:predicted dehydrogenase